MPNSEGSQRRSIDKERRGAVVAETRGKGAEVAMSGIDAVFESSRSVQSIECKKRKTNFEISLSQPHASLHSSVLDSRLEPAQQS